MLADSCFVDIELRGVRQLHRGHVVARGRMDGRGYVIRLIEHLERIERERAETVAVFIPIAVELCRLDLIAKRDPQSAAVADECLQTFNALWIQLGEIVD